MLPLLALFALGSGVLQLGRCNVLRAPRAKRGTKGRFSALLPQALQESVFRAAEPPTTARNICLSGRLHLPQTPLQNPNLFGTPIVAPSVISIGGEARSQADRILIHSSLVLYIHFATLEIAILAERVENQ
jgi:hypothetical protein